MKKQSKRVTDVLAEKYAEIFVAYFDRVSATPTDPFLVPSPYPQQNVSGHVYTGANSLLTSLMASEQGYEFPVWMTVNQANAAGLSVRTGEKGTPIKFGTQWLVDAQTGKRVPVTMDEYDRMSSEEKAAYRVMNAPKTYHVFNIGQTDFVEKFPEKAEEMRRMISGPKQNDVSEELVDRAVSRDEWLCPVRLLDASTLPAYLYDRDVIVSPGKDVFVDGSNYYSSMLYMMAMSTGHEDRAGWLKGHTDPASGRWTADSMDRLSAQLASAMLGSLLGITTPVNQDNLSYMKRWSTEISADPKIIGNAVSVAAKATAEVSRALGVGVRKGVDFTKVLGDIDEALAKAREERKQKTSEGRKNVTFRLKR